MTARLQPKGMVAVLPASLVASVLNNRPSTGAAAEMVLKEKQLEFSRLSLALVTRWCFSSRLSVSGLCCRVFCCSLEEEP